jgi:nicotinate-nucleotide adenylyltransferase
VSGCREYTLGTSIIQQSIEASLLQIGLFCGTFNPIHLGHLLIGECARDQFDLSVVLYVTSPNPPHRKEGLLDAGSRHELVSLAVADNSHFQASDLELSRAGPSYTADTVRQVIASRSEEVEVNLILGGDNLPHLQTWHDSEYLIATCRLLVAPRTVYERDPMPSVANGAHDLPVLEPLYKVGPVQTCDIPGARVEIIDFPHVAISSSLIRERLSQGQSVLYMVPKAVNNLLLQRQFYA